MDWKDAAKKAGDKAQDADEQKASDAARSKATEELGQTAAQNIEGGINAARQGGGSQFVKYQQEAAKKRAEEAAERKTQEETQRAASQVADKFGDTAGQATADGLNAARQGETDAFAKQQEAAAKDRAKDTAERKIAEQLSDNTAAEARQAAAMSAEEKRELLKDMEITHTSQQTQTQEEMLANAAGTQGMGVEEKRELLKDMDVSYTSTQTQSQEEMLSGAAQPQTTGASNSDLASAANTQSAATESPMAAPSAAAAAGEPPAEVDEDDPDSAPPPDKVAFAPNNVNKLVLPISALTVRYQIDLDNPNIKDDEITLTQDQGGFEQTIAIGKLKPVDVDWVELNFNSAPANGTYTLVLDTKDGLPPLKLFKEIPYSKLKTIKH